MKKLLLLILISILISPQVAFGAFAATWTGTSTSPAPIWIMPTRINGVDPTVLFSNFIATSTTATSTINGPVVFNGTTIDCLSIDSPTFVIDCANNKVGIGSTSPYKTLSVSGSAHITNYLNVGSTTPFQVLYNIPFEVWSNGNTYAGMVLGNRSSSTDASADFLLNNDGTDASGTHHYVDCGMNSTKYTLATYTGFNQPNQFYCYSTNGNIGFFAISATTSEANFIVGTGGGAAANERLRVTGEGKFGFGTTSPQFLFSVAGLTGSGNNQAMFAGTAPAIRMLDTNGTADAREIQLVVGASANPSSLIFRSLNDSGSIRNSILSMDFATGNLGIGTTTALSGERISVIAPTNGFALVGTDSDVNNDDKDFYIGSRNYSNSVSPLRIIGSRSTATDNLIYYGGSGTLNSLGTAATQHLWYTSTATTTTNGGTERMRLDATGDVGIGSTSPWGKLSVTNTGTDPSFVVEDTTSPDATPFLIDANGNVGVGSSSPSRKFSIAGLTQSTGIGTAPFILNITGSPGALEMGVDTGGSPFIQGIRADTNAARNLLLQPYGANVGLGTTTPNSKLSVYSGAAGVNPPITTGISIEHSTDTGISMLTPDNAQTYITFGNTSDSNAVQFEWDPVTDIFSLGTANAGADLRIMAGDNSEKVRILDTGEVGIGTTTPTSRLHISAGANATTTATLGELGLSTSKGCINMNTSAGTPASFYINAAGLIISELNYCRN